MTNGGDLELSLSGESDLLQRERFDSTEPLSSYPSSLASGLRIAGRYELTRRVGFGSMGEVWAARHLSLDEEVAIKLVRSRARHVDGSSSDARFRVEARIAAQLSRKTRHVVSVTDHGEDGDYAYLVMELLPGESLEDRLDRSGTLPLAKVVPLVYQIARALSVAHADGVVHRDLKPSNVFVTVDEENRALIKILDFGIAKLCAPANSVRDLGDAKKMTLNGMILGTPAFMSPEQARGMPIDHRADVWALAVIAFNLLTREVPFDGDTMEELLDRLNRVAPMPVTAYRKDLPDAVGELFARAFAPEIADRFQSAAAFARALEQVGTGVPAPAAGTGRAPGVCPTPVRVAPRPMAAISLPPPCVVGVPALEPRAPRRDPSLIAAGVPPKGVAWPKLAGAAALLSVVVGTASILAVYFEREPPAGLSAGAGWGEAREGDDRNAIPPPEPASVTVPSPVDPPAPALVVAPVTHAARSLATTASLPPKPPPDAPVRQASSNTIDRSEVF